MVSLRETQWLQMNLLLIHRRGGWAEMLSCCLGMGSELESSVECVDQSLIAPLNWRLFLLSVARQGFEVQGKQAEDTTCIKESIQSNERQFCVVMRARVWNPGLLGFIPCSGRRKKRSRGLVQRGWESGLPGSISSGEEGVGSSGSEQGQGKANSGRGLADHCSCKHASGASCLSHAAVSHTIVLLLSLESKLLKFPEEGLRH